MNPTDNVSEYPPPSESPLHHEQQFLSGRRSLPPSGSREFQGPLTLPSYPSSTIHYYYPQPHAPYGSLPPSASNPPHGGAFAGAVLPSASQSRVPSLRHTPSIHSDYSVPHHDKPVTRSPLLAQVPHLDDHSHISNYKSPFLDPHLDNTSRASQRFPSTPPNFNLNPPPPPVLAPQPVPAHSAPFSPSHLPYFPQHFAPPLLAPAYHGYNNPSTLPTNFNPSLPSTKDVPILSGKHDWGPWHSAVRTLILNANLLGHIADDPLPGAAYDPGLWPTYPPVVHRGSTPHDVQVFNDWWSRDGLASHILTSRLSPSVLGCLPLANERMGQRRSSRTIYITLRHQFGAGDYSAVMVIEARLRQLKCLPARGGVRLSEFITVWRTSLNQMDAAGFLPGPRQLLTIFADGLPHHTVAFVNLYDNIISWLNEPNDHMLPNIHQLFDRAVNIDNNIQRTRILNPNPRSLPSTTASTLAPNPSAVVPPSTAPNIPPSTKRRCSNCGREGHTDDTCFQPGGAMEGKRDEYLANHFPKLLAHIAEVEETHVGNGEGIADTEDNPLSTEFAAMSLTTSNEIDFSTYVFSSISEMLLDNPLAFKAISLDYNSALDSACTNHIFHDRTLFHTYNVDGAVSIKTANCGTLPALAIGDVKIKLKIGDKHITWTLRDCLHAPTVPINLISVGALQEHHMSVTFSFQKTTISFPPTHPLLSGLSFDAYVTRRLSLLNLEFLMPPTQALPVALYLFPNTPLSPEIWHRRFGHLGHEASKNVLNGQYATGITKPSMPYPLSPRCIPCLIGKSPQAPYSNNAKRAASVCDLVHIDTCGPFPTLTPKKEAYFTIFLDDKSNYGVTTLLTNKSGAFQACKKVEASWELTSGNRIKTVRLDGAKEFVQGPLLAHFNNRGITMQVTAPYAHAQAGKAERYVRTIEDGVQTLLADAKLPPSFWGDAALTTQYLRNRLPTSTLPSNTTPYEIMHGIKPDLSHLRVWGCQCFPAIPPELRTKGGPRRYEAIFVGYDDN